MRGQTRSASSTTKPGVLREGWRELVRRRQRRALRKKAQKTDQDRNAALMCIGEAAWSAKLDLSGEPELQDQLRGFDLRTRYLAETTKKLENEREDFSSQRQATSARFDEQRNAVLQLKLPVDQALTAARQRLAEENIAIQKIQARSSALTAEHGAIEKELASLGASSAPETATQLAVRQSRKQALQVELSQAAQESATLQLALPQVSGAVSRFFDESQRYDNQLKHIEAVRRAALSPIEASLERVGRDINAAMQETATIAQNRGAAFTQLGLKLHERKCSDPALGEGLRNVAALDQSGAATQLALRASLAESQAMPSRTMLKFWSTVVLTPMFLLACAYGSYRGWVWWQGRHAPEEYVEVPRINPYLVHPLSQNPAYTLASRIANAGNEQEVTDRMMDAFLSIHLGVYTPDGKQVLAGSERSAKDFYLYDFQLPILAHSFFQHNSMNFEDHSRMLGAALLRLDHPEKLTPLLKRVVLLRYKDAVQHPDDPKSFLILLVDGLARNKPEPYSLSEIVDRPAEDLDVDALQSLLIMLDFFAKPQGNMRRTSSSMWFPWNWVGTVHAQNPCAGVEGDKESEWAEQGLELAITAAEQGGDLASKVLTSPEAREMAETLASKMNMAGTAVDVASGISDLVTLYGITVTVIPIPALIHLRHESPVILAFSAFVNVPSSEGGETIPCGPMAGEAIPVSGTPLKDAELTWNIVPDWPSYLTVSHEELEVLGWPGHFVTHTDLNGKSMFVVEAGECPDKRGTIVGQNFQMKVTARVLTRKMPSPATGLSAPTLIAKLLPGGVEYVMNGKKGYCPFRVEWHKYKPPKKAQRGG